eukprot:scaffold30_cov133-Chaetoceros_neogracile.AAC.3
MIDDLKSFDFPEFAAEFLWNMKKELPALLHLVTNFEYDFEEEDPDGTKDTNSILSRARRARKRAILKEIEERIGRNEVNGEGNEIPADIEAEIRHVYEVIREIGDDDFRVMDWNRDPGERSRRIHEWWRNMMNGYNTKPRTFAEAVNLVVSIQPSSAASERVL